MYLQPSDYWKHFWSIFLRIGAVSALLHVFLGNLSFTLGLMMSPDLLRLYPKVTMGQILGGSNDPPGVIFRRYIIALGDGLTL